MRDCEDGWFAKYSELLLLDLDEIIIFKRIPFIPVLRPRGIIIDISAGEAVGNG